MIHFYRCFVIGFFIIGLVSCGDTSSSDTHSGINDPTSTTAVTLTENIHESLPSSWITEYNTIKNNLLTLFCLYIKNIIPLLLSTLGMTMSQTPTQVLKAGLIFHQKMG